MGQARVRKHDTDLGSRPADQAFGLPGRDAVLRLTRLRNAGTGTVILIGDHEYVRADRGARRVRDYPAAPVNLVGEMRVTGLMEPEEGSAGIVQTSGVPGAG